MKCGTCGADLPEDAQFCPKCGSETSSDADNFIIVTTPTIPGYRIKKVFGVVTGLTPRTRGFLGKFVAGFESMFGGEVTAFTSELEKARVDAMQRVKDKARSLGANAIVGLDMESSDIGLQLGVVVISATGTAVLVEKE
ncbi:MAG: heavy metal-binding domain-containing protein [Candidatus Bathyarchaeota archaeon]